MDTRFHCVYLLSSLNPQCEGAHYIGYTLNPLRRLRQHNGELVNGARRTRMYGRPWVLLMCVSGFGEDRIALKFEWCWQKPSKSAVLKARMSELRCVHGLTRAVGTLLLLLRAEPFSHLRLTAHIFEPAHFDRVMEQLLSAAPGVTPLVETSLLRVERTTTEEFQKCYLDDAQWGNAPNCGAYFIRAPPGAGNSDRGNCDTDERAPGNGNFRGINMCEEDIIRQHVRELALLESGCLLCSLCSLPLKSPYFLRCSRTPFCGLRTHIVCLAMWFIYDSVERRSVCLTKDAETAENCSTTAFQSGGGSVSSPDGCVTPHSGGRSAVQLERGRSNSPLPPTALSQSSPSDARGVSLVPREPCGCPLCNEELQWGALLYDLKRRVTVEKYRAKHERCEAAKAVLAQRLQHIQSASEKMKLGGLNRKRRRPAEAPLMRTKAPELPLSACRGDSINRRSWAPFASSREGADGQLADARSPVGSPCDDVLKVTEFNVDEWVSN